MALNKSKTRKIFITYMIVMQFIATIIGMAIFGYFIGNKIDKTSNLSLILTAVGLALGVMIGFMTLLQLMKSEERYERRIRH
ncbi:MAG: AtpZ/AtpI family protein [Acholeplasmataceae bacterium]|nr:AtpZ/AtpI family protein [Acholeplasmataceae bacterium]